SHSPRRAWTRAPRTAVQLRRIRPTLQGAPARQCCCNPRAILMSIKLHPPEGVMARAKKTARKSTRRAASRPRKAATNDAIALLKADHREVESWFEQFESARAESRQEELARKICQALKVHTEIEHEIFYPAFLEATGEEDIHHEAEVEHDGAKKLIAEIERGGPSDDYFDAR